MTDVWFGDIAVGILTSKDTDISKEVVEKNFVDEPVQVYELTPDLEAGNYSLILNKEMHPRSETLQEQRDAVVSMPQRSVSEFPFATGGDKGHVLVGQANASFTPSQMVDEAEIGLRFLDDGTYRPAFDVKSQAIEDDFSLGSSSYVALSASTENVSESSTYTISSRDGDLNLYTYTDNVIEYDRNSSNYTVDERESPVRVTNTDGERVYSDTKFIGEGAELENGLVKSTVSTDAIDFDYYDSGWRSIGNVNINVSNGFCKKNETYHSKMTFVEDKSVSLRKGFPAFKYKVTSRKSFKFDSDESLTTESTDSAYRIVSNNSGDDIIVMRTENVGSFSVNSSSVEVTGLSSSETYEFFVGIIPSGINNANFAEYLYNIGSQERTMVQR